MTRMDPTSNDLITPSDPESLAYVQRLVRTGKAVAPNAEGALQPGATHVIVGQTPEGWPILRRVRFAGGA